MPRIRGAKTIHSVRRLGEDENGQTLIIVILAIVGLLAIIGLGVDVGLVYAKRVRLAQAIDAAALAGAQELPNEKAAHYRALEYLGSNGFDTDAACIETHGSDLRGAPGSCDSSSATTVITIDTASYRRSVGIGENAAYRINVRANQKVPLTFVRVIGFNSVPVGASSTAENIEDLDIAIMYDRSGSMKEDTRCYGCWEEDPEHDYPSGSTYPLPFTAHCQPSDPLDYAGYQYLSIEAEHYSSYLVEADYHRDRTEWPKTWWALQRQPGRNASGPDARGAFMKVGPHTSSAMHYDSIDDIVHPTDAEPFFTTPRLDYDFTIAGTITRTFYVWMRAQGGAISWPDPQTRRQVYVGLNGTPMATGITLNHGPYNDGADANLWVWTRVLQLHDLNVGQSYTLNFWAAGPGFSLDKIVITNDSRPDLNHSPHPLVDRGPDETHGRSDWACMGAEDPRFSPIDSETGDLDDLYDDFQPIRAAKEAAKNFVRRLNPELDQIGYVWYSSSSEIEKELYCLKQGLGCSDFENVVAIVESTSAEGSTNIADAMWDGIRVLTTGREPDLNPSGIGFPPKEPSAQHYGRPSAAHILILMTDGQATRYPTLPAGYGNCYSDELWPDQPDETSDERRARECVVWFALQARDENVVIYTIGLGAQADSELLSHVADVTAGLYFYASMEQLDEIFESLYERVFRERIFLRLTE